MKKITKNIKVVILLATLLSTYITYSSTVHKKELNEMAPYEENIIVYGLHFQYSIGLIKEYYPTAISFIAKDIPKGLTLDLDTGIMEGIPLLMDGTNNVSYDPYILITNEDETISSIPIGEYTITRPVGLFELFDTKNGDWLSNTGYSTHTLTVDITNSNDFAIVANDYALEYALYYSTKEEFEPNGIEADFYVNGSFFKKERAMPYALNGDVRGTFNNIPFKEGSYEISVRFYSTVFDKYISEPVSFTLKIIDNSLDSLVLYPNPANDIITLANVPNDENVSVTIRDTKTNTIVREAVIGSIMNNEVAIEDLHPGIYLAQFTYANTVKVIEFIKE